MAEGGGIHLILEEYQHFMVELDTWFRSVRVKYGDRMQCGKGCILCCCGLFDVSIPDAFNVAAGIQRLPLPTREEIHHRARSLHEGILRDIPEVEEPFLLDRIPENRIDRLADRFDTVRCPFLAADDDCLIYEFRPSACILEGVPMVDFQDGPFDDWCGLNFKEGLDRDVKEDLRLDYYGVEEMVRRASEDLMVQLPFLSRRETTVFVPSIVVAFDCFWRDLVAD